MFKKNVVRLVSEDVNSDLTVGKTIFILALRNFLLMVKVCRRSKFQWASCCAGKARTVFIKCCMFSVFATSVGQVTSKMEYIIDY